MSVNPQKSVFVLGMLLYFCFPQFASGELCSSVIQGRSAPTGRNQNNALERYLEWLVQERLIEGPRLEGFLQGLGRGQWINPFRHSEIGGERIFENSSENIHYDHLQDHLGHQSDIEGLRGWAEAMLRRLRQESSDRSSAQNETKYPWLDPEFIRVPKGRVECPDGSELIIPYDFEMMTTPVTLSMWVYMFGQYPEKEPVPQAANGHFPVRYVTVWSAMKFANLLSIRHNLVPAYRLDRVWNAGTSAGAGTLKGERVTTVQMGEVLVSGANGYRLPRFEHLLWAQELAGVANMSVHELSKYAWLANGNPGPEIHEVGMKDPFQIEGQLIYDLLGNTTQMTETRWEVLFKRERDDEMSTLVAYPNYDIAHFGEFYRSPLKFANQLFPDEFGSAHSFRLIKPIISDNR